MSTEHRQKKSHDTRTTDLPGSSFNRAEEESRSACPFVIAGIGASAGGLEALTQLLACLPGDLDMAIVIVQHLDPQHASMAAEILARSCKMPVTEATDGATVEPGHVFVMPSGTEIGLEGCQLRLFTRAAGAHLPIDRFFRSLAQQQKSNAIGVVLSGTGSDGALGLEEINAEGGITFAQSAGSAKYDGMPKAAAAAGVDFVLSPDRIARDLQRIAENGAAPPVTDEKEPGVAQQGEDMLADIFAMLRQATGTDFTHYRRHFILRRISRRMMVHRSENLEQYAEILQSTPDEIGALHRELLVGVTGFFRNPGLYASLKEKVFPAILSRAGDTPVRIWVPGCSQGQEVYSIAMCLLESMGSEQRNPPVQIYGTDVSDEAIAKARDGQYIENIELDVSPERLRRFFVKEAGHYRVSRPTRELCLFARHDLVKDPPFPSLDLVSCQNLLIYMDETLQHRLIPLFRYALKHSGFLVLGSSETVGPYSNLFETVDKGHRVYLAVGSLDAGQYLSMQRHGGGMLRAPQSLPLRAALTSPMDMQRQVERLLASEYAPAGVLVNDVLDVVQYRGDTTPYLMPAAGQASQSLFRMAREGLVPALRAAIREARTSGRPVRKEGVQVRSREGLRKFALRVLPLKIASPADGLLILFEETPPENTEPAGASQPAALPAGDTAANLQHELELMKEFLNSVIEDREAAHEELQSSNEELLSSNEELQSINEELESAKEELESANEELTVVNQELQGRNAELAAISSDLRNILTSANIPMLIFAQDLSLRRFTAGAARIFGISAAEVGRPLTRPEARLHVPGIEQMVLEVIESLVPKETEARDANGRWFKVTIRPSRNEENRIDGAVAMFTDIDLLKRSEIRLQQLFDRTFQAPQDGMLLVDALTGVILNVNSRLTDILGVPAQELNGQEIWNVAVLQPLVASAADLKKFSETPYWHYEARWLIAKPGNRVSMEVISIVHVLQDRDTIQFALRTMPTPQELGEVLTKREIQVLTLLAKGSSTKEAAADLGIAFKTAVGHRTAVMRKLGVHDTASMVRYAIRAGFVKA